MTSRLAALLGIIAFAAAAAAQTGAPRLRALMPVEPIALPPGIDMFVAPHDDIEDEIVKMIDGAQVEILTSQYVMTSPRIVRALVEASRRKVFVAVILEARPNLREYETPAFLRMNSVPVLVRRASKGLNNHKFWVIDRGTVLTGSYDCTMAAATVNDENLIKIKDAGVAVAYYNTWVEQASRCVPYQ